MYNYNPYGNQNNGFGLPMQQPSGEPVWVQGMAGAQSSYVQPGKTGFFFDIERPVFYAKTVDQNGMPRPLEEYEYKKIDPQQMKQGQGNDMSQYVTKDELKAILAEREVKNERPVQKIRKPDAQSGT